MDFDFGCISQKQKLLIQIVGSVVSTSLPLVGHLIIDIRMMECSDFSKKDWRIQNVLLRHQQFVDRNGKWLLTLDMLQLEPYYEQPERAFLLRKSAMTSYDAPRLLTISVFRPRHLTIWVVGDVSNTQIHLYILGNCCFSSPFPYTFEYPSPSPCNLDDQQLGRFIGCDG